MKTLLMKLLISFGFKLLQEHIDGDEDSSDIEEKLISAGSREEVLVIAKNEAIRAVDEYILLDVEIPEEVVDGLVNAANTKEVVKVFESEAGQRTIFDVLGEVISGLGRLLAGLFGKKG